MKAISLWQPWASALFAPFEGSRLKGYETRHWRFPDAFIGEEIAIHAAKRDTPDEREFWQDVVLDSPRRKDYAVAFGALGIRCYADLPRGCLIGTVRFRAALPTVGLEMFGWPECDWGNYLPGRFAWPVFDCKPFSNPLPFVGRQGFFDVPDSLILTGAKH